MRAHVCPELGIGVELSEADFATVKLWHNARPGARGRRMALARLGPFFTQACVVALKNFAVTNLQQAECSQ